MPSPAVNTGGGYFTDFVRLFQRAALYSKHKDDSASKFYHLALKHEEMKSVFCKDSSGSVPLKITLSDMYNRMNEH